MAEAVGVSGSGHRRGSPRAPERSLWRVLGQFNFGLFFAGNLLSNTGGFFQNIAQALLIFQMTHSSFAVGLVSFAQSITSLVLSPWAGTVADRADRRVMLIATQVASVLIAAGLAVLTFAGRINEPLIIGGALLLGLASTFSLPAMYAIVPALVAAEDVRAAVSMNAVTFNVARAIGPVLGVVVVDRLGFGWAFGLNALSYLALIGAMIAVKPRATVRSAKKAETRDLFRLAIGNRNVLALLGIVAIVTLTYDPIATLGPGLAVRVFNHPDTWAGYFLGSFGAGAVAATLLRLRQPSLRRLGLLLGVFGAGMLAYALAPSIWVAVATPVVAGAGYLLANTGAQVLLLEEAGEEQAGQVMALWSMAFSGVRPAAGLIDGGIADSIGIRTAGVAMTLPALAVAVMALASGRLARRPVHGSGR